MRNQWMLKFFSITAFLLIFLLGGCVVYDLGKVDYPPVEQTWLKEGWNSAQVRIELTACYRQRKLPDELLSTASFDEDDLCMLRKGFAPLPNPYRYRWFDPCDLRPQRVKCRVYRGELVIPPDETALQIKPDPLVKLKPVPGYVECRKDKPKYEAAYCECSLRTPYENPDPCVHLLKYQDRSVDKQVEPSPEKPEPAPMTPVLNPSEQVLRENLKELQRAQDKTQIKPYTPPTNLPVIPQAPNPRLEKLLKGR